MLAETLLSPPARHHGGGGPTGPQTAWPEMAGVVMTFGRDEEIFGEGEPADCLYRVVSGAVRTFRVLTDGRRQINDFYLPSDLFGLDATTEHRLTAEAVSDSRILVVRRRAVMELAARDPAVAGRFWALATQGLRRSQDHILMLGRKSASERVATFLVDCARRAGAEDSFELPMSRQDMADFLGLTIETVSRTLTQLQGSGMIGLPSYRRVVLRNLRGLTRLSA